VNVVHGVFGSACYIDDSFPSMLFLAYKYAGGAAGCQAALERPCIDQPAPFQEQQAQCLA
jgi:hypothetical protein